MADDPSSTHQKLVPHCHTGTSNFVLLSCILVPDFVMLVARFCVKSVIIYKPNYWFKWCGLFMW